MKPRINPGQELTQVMRENTTLKKKYIYIKKNYTQVVFMIDSVEGPAYEVTIAFITSSGN